MHLFRFLCKGKDYRWGQADMQSPQLVHRFLLTCGSLSSPMDIAPNGQARTHCTHGPYSRNYSLFSPSESIITALQSSIPTVFEPVDTIYSTVYRAQGGYSFSPSATSWPMIPPIWLWQHRTHLQDIHLIGAFSFTTR